MDKKTFAQFLIVSAVILLGWWGAGYLLYGPDGFKRAGRPAPVAEPEPQPPLAAEPEPPAPFHPEAPAPGVLTKPEDERKAEPQEVVLSNEKLQIVLTNRGAALSRLTITDPRFRAPYYEGDERPPLTLLRDFQEGTYSDTISSVTFSDAPGSNQLEEPTADLAYHVVEQSPSHAVFERSVRDAQGHALGIRKTVTLPDDSFHYQVALEFTNIGETPYELAYDLRGAAGIERESLQAQYLGTKIGLRGRGNDYDIASRPARKLEQVDPKPNESADIAWAAVANHYFAAVVRPEDTQWIREVASQTIVEEDLLNASGRWNTPTVRRMQKRQSLAANASVVIRSVPAELRPGESTVRRYDFIATPKAKNTLRAYGTGLENLLEMGLFSPLSRLVLLLLDGIQALVRNYGIAILILTAIIRAALHPLTRKQQISMIKMQKLQPQINALQRKYADDKQKLTQEQMALFQKYNVHPLSGCGPMLLQLPVLWALFRALRAAIQLRHAGFLWIDDLSLPDTIFRLPFALPVMGDGVNPLPILMVVVMFLQQKSMPTAASEQAREQQKMMKWFPLFFVVLFYNMPSGLVLYWTTSTAIGLLERWIVNRHAEQIELLPREDGKRKKGKQPTATSKPKKMGWLERLQKMAEEQERAGRQRKKR